MPASHHRRVPPLSAPPNKLVSLLIVPASKSLEKGKRRIIISVSITPLLLFTATLNS
nr:MAG TPA: hypothetical protein [Caudoviricetes sp.]